MLPRGYRVATLEDLFNLKIEADRLECMIDWAKRHEQGHIDIDDLPGARGTGAWKRNGHNEGHGALRIPVAVVEDYLKTLQSANAVMGLNDLSP
ncbi:MAG: hypothetical protein ACK4VI_06480 [Alphaproteobacteria bacterium]